MATNPTIQLKRKTSGSGAPASLSVGEPAFNTTQNFLYVGNGSAVKWVGAEILDSGTTAFTSDTQLATRKAIGDNFLLRTTVSSLTLGSGAQARFTETGGGTDYVALQAPTAVSTGNVIYTLPGAYPGSAGYVLQADTSGNMTWAAPSSSANVGVTATSTSTLFKMLFTDVNATNTSASLFIDTTSGVRFNPSTNELSNEGAITTYSTLSALGGGLAVYNSSNASTISVGALEAVGHSFRIASTEDDDIFVSQTVTNHNPGLNNSSTMTIGNGYYTTYNVFPIDNSYWANDENPGAATINIGSGGSLAQTYSGFGITKSINIGAGTGAGNETWITLGSDTGGTLINLGAPGPMSSILAYGNLTISGSITMLSGTITANTTTFNLFNTTVTNANVLGAANTVVIGGTGGTTTIRNAGTNINGTLTVTGATVLQGALTLNSSLTVTGATTFQGALSTNSTLSVTSNATFASNIIVNGGSIQTTSSTFNLITNTASIINIGTISGSSINIGNGGSTTQLNGNLSVKGSGGTSSIDAGSSTYANLFNTTVTGINFAGAADQIYVGSANSTAFFAGAINIGSAKSFLINGTPVLSTSTLGSTVTDSTLTRINSSNLRLTGSVEVNGGTITSSSTTFNLLNTTVTNANVLGGANTINIGSSLATINLGTGTTGANVYVKGNLFVQGATTTISSTTVSIADLNITLADGQATTANVNGAGITLGSTGITWQYNNTGNNWESTENISIATGKTFKINNSPVLSSSALGSSITSASGIVHVGTIGLGTWQGTTIGVAYGGTGLTTYTTGAVVYATAATTLANLAPVTTSGAVLSSTGLNSNPEYKTITLSYGTVTSAANSLSLTIQNAVADGTTKGVATFNSTQFDDASGVITLDTIDGGTYA